MAETPDAHSTPSQTGPTPARDGVVLVAIAVAAAIIVLVIASQFMGSGDGEATTLPNASLTDLDGNPVELDSLGGVPMVVNFFASWCRPCKDEMPDFQQVYTARAGEVAFVGINVKETDADAALRLISDTGVTYPVLLGADADLLEAVGGTLMPTTVLVDADGVIVETVIGALHAEQLDEKIDALVG